ncbi:unnamed protein product [Gordionus sp. m RMFG-2023]
MKELGYIITIVCLLIRLESIDSKEIGRYQGPAPLINPIITNTEPVGEFKNYNLIDRKRRDAKKAAKAIMVTKLHDKDKKKKDKEKESESKSSSSSSSSCHKKKIILVHIH